MRLCNKNVLLVSPEPWNHIFVSKHHYAVHLSRKKNTVFFLNPPGRHSGVLSTQFDGVYELNYTGFPKGLRYYPRVIQRWIIRRVFAALECACYTHFDVVWSFDNSVFYDFSALPDEVLRISHVVDFNQNFQIRKTASTADFCFCTTEMIRKRLSAYNERTFKIHHGYNVPRSSPAKAPGGNRVKALYAGNLSIGSIDWRLLSEAVAQHPEVDFIFVGPNAQVPGRHHENRCAKERIMRAANARFIGRVDADDLHAHYQSADILLISYQERYQADQVSNPHKMMEYLGSGKVVVATLTLEFLDLYPLVVMSGKNGEWSELFSRVLLDLQFFNSERLQAERRAFAWKHRYEEQINKIEHIIGTL